MATQWISKQTTRRQAAPPTWCPLLQRQVPCTALEVWHVRPDGRTGERVTAPSGDPVMVPVGHHGEMSNYLYGRRGRFALVARDHLGRIAGRRDFEETDDFCWAGSKTTEQRLNEQIGALRAELRESRQRCADLSGRPRSACSTPRPIGLSWTARRPRPSVGRAACRTSTRPSTSRVTSWIGSTG